MSITDLLWACPVCGAHDALKDGGRGRGKGARCTRCGSEFRRTRGALIEVLRPDGTRETAPPAHWLDALPPIDVLMGNRPIREASATLRIAGGERAIREAGRYLNRIELFGKPATGRLRLLPDRVEFRGEDQSDTVWAFADLTAIQPSSHTLQLKARSRAVASLRFQDDSVRLWEELLMHAVRDFYRRTGRGDVVEFQPRISLR